MNNETERDALSQYANPLNWDVDESGIRRVWLEPGSSTPDGYHGFELARAALSPASLETERDALLLPCPFCKSGNVHSLFDGALSWVECRNCRADGPLIEGEDGTQIDLWNRRTTTKPTDRESPPHFDVDAMLVACVPGGSSCDPQRVADAIREYCAVAHPQPAERSAELEAVQRDAQRYRWIRYRTSSHGVIDGWAFAFPTHRSLPAPVEAMRDPANGLDIAIDAAIAAAPQKGDK